MFRRVLLTLSWFDHRSTEPAAAFYVFTRQYAVTTSGIPSQYKSKLRELYKKIHPDTVHFSPEAAKANQKSFALLQEYLDAAVRGEGGIGRTAGLPYHFQFFLRNDIDHEHQDEGDEGTNNRKHQDLHLVKLTLPPPTRGSPHEVLSAATRKALSRLLSACGLADNLSAAQDHTQSMSLQAFIPGAAELQHQAATKAAGTPRHHLAAVRTALRLSRGVMGVSCEGGFSGAAATQQLDAFNQLAATLGALPDLDVQGLKLGLGDGYGIDDLGTIWMHWNGGQDAWQRFLQGVDVKQCRQRLALLAAVRKQEAKLAQALGVALLHTHITQCLDSAYTAFLQHIADVVCSGEGTSPLPAAIGREVSILVALPPPIDPGEEGSTSSLTLGKHGAINVTTNIDARDLLRQLAIKAPAAAAAARASRQIEEDAARLRTQVERRLHLRRVLRDPSLPMDYYLSCCRRMLGQSQELMPLLDGLTIRISWVNAAPTPEKEFIDIAWNYQL